MSNKDYLKKEIEDLRRRWRIAKEKGDTQQVIIIESKVQAPPFNLKLKRSQVWEARDIFTNSL